MMFVPMMSAGMRSGVNWIRENDEVEALGERLDQEGLAQARHALEQDVAAGEHAREHVGDDLVVADDDLRDGAAGGLEGGDHRHSSSHTSSRAPLSRRGRL